MCSSTKQVLSFPRLTSLILGVIIGVVLGFILGLNFPELGIMIRVQLFVGNQFEKVIEEKSLVG